MKNASLLVSFIMLSHLTAFAQSTWMDSTFSQDGIVSFAADSPRAWISALTLQGDGKILAICNYGNYLINSGAPFDNSMVIRLNTDGSLDNTFGQNGIKHLNLWLGGDGSDIQVQTDGKIMIAVNQTATQSDNALVRLHHDGSFDSTFGTNGIAYQGSQMGYFANSVLPLHNNQYLVGATEQLIWFDQSGNVANSQYVTISDTTFNGVGIINIIEAPDSTLLISGNFAGTFTCLYSFVGRLKADGRFDSTFGTNGYSYMTSYPIGPDSMFIDNSANSMALLADGKILIAGSLARSDNLDSSFVARYLPNGQLDPSFGQGGITTFPSILNRNYIEKMQVESNGQIILSGNEIIYNGPLETFNLFLSRLNPDGSIDSSFGDHGLIRSPFLPAAEYYTLSLQQDGKILCGGYKNYTDSTCDFIISRYLTYIDAGIVDAATHPIQLYAYPNPVRQQETLRYVLANEEEITITLTDIDGHTIKIFTDKQPCTVGEHYETLSMPDTLAKGMYIINIRTAGQQRGIKVTKN